MICHKHKCIFIHIPRTGGTSFETDIYGQNWFRLNKGSETKHLIASTAKKIYKEYWNDYFKFSLVRNPWDRMVSMASSFPEFYGVEIKHNKICLNGYINQFSSMEIDPRSKSIEETFSPNKGAVYLNILNEELDFIGKFENLQEDFNTICEKIKIPQRKLQHENSSTHENYIHYYNKEARETVEKLHAKDIKYFGYKFGE